MVVPFAFMVAFVVLISLAERFFSGTTKLVFVLVLAGCLGFAIPTFAEFTRWDILENTLTNHIMSVVSGVFVGLLISFKIAPESHLFRYMFQRTKRNDPR